MSTQHVSFQQASPNEQAVILIVDDVPENLGLLHESLDQAGIACLLQPMG
ncbi:response regulator [Acinetobacter baumannii 24812_6]|nr:response regulator [Acinetobacter baumannii 24812_6]